MIAEAEIRRYAARWQVDPRVVDQDYSLGWFLAALSVGTPASVLRFRGGTCLRKQTGETVRLLGLPDKTGRPASVMDVLHRAATLWEQGDREALVRFLAEGARGREEHVRLVAQTIIKVLSDGDAERRLLDGFLAGRDTLPEAPSQEKLP